MARRRRARGPGRFAGPHEPGSIGDCARRYLEWLRVHHYADATVKNREVYLSFFTRWCEERAIARPEEVSRPVLERYQRHLFYYRKADGRPLSFRSQHGRLVTVRAFFRWLAREHLLLFNPASELVLPKLEQRLPRHVLSAREVERVLAEPDLEDPLGLRDRAILETLYSTGMRRLELLGLKLYDLDAERGTLMIRRGKGKKDRMVPVGERAVRWIDRYLEDARPSLVVEPDDGTLFLSAVGEPIAACRLTELVRGYVNASGTEKKGSCHLFRHTMATLMLEGGADIRFIQQMLGHAELSTTEIYTQVSIRKLKQIHAATHPGAQLRPRARAEAGDANDEHELAGEPTADDLLSSLAAEDDGEEHGDDDGDQRSR